MGNLLNKQQPFHVLTDNPNGARYFQDGEFYGCGGQIINMAGQLQNRREGLRRQEINRHAGASIQGISPTPPGAIRGGLGGEKKITNPYGTLKQELQRDTDKWLSDVVIH